MTGRLRLAPAPAAPRPCHGPAAQQRFAEWRRLVCIAALAGAQATAFASSRIAFVSADDATLSADERIAAASLLADAAARLPATWAAALDAPIEIQWRDDLPAHVAGRAQQRRILLDRALLQRWQRRDVADGSIDPGARAALATVLHELAHLYDRTPAGRLSRDPRLLDLAGWQVRPLRFGLRASANPFSDRTPDAYELESPVEFIAVNLEHYLLDPEYACRRPALHRYFSAHFQAATPTRDCGAPLVYLPAASADADADHASGLQTLDVARVQSVEYLLAEGNDQAMSRWGHSMLRLVVCAPGRPRGPDCRHDLQHHLVLSFRAFVDDVQISSWRGLTGSYPSRLFLLPLDQVIEEYTRTELRGLQSIPLRLDDDGIARLLERAAQLHWSYDGRYYFVGNNCAVETFKLLHDADPRLADAQLSSITPNGLLRRLQRAGIADTGVLDDGDRARRLGYYFESADTHYQAMFDVARQSLALPQPTVAAWLALAPGDRAPWLQQADLRAAAALLLLEQAAHRRQQLQVRDALKRMLLKPAAQHTPARATPDRGTLDRGTLDRGIPDTATPVDYHDDDARTQLQALLQLEGLLSRPSALLPGDGYGVPQPDERAAFDQVSRARRQQWQDQRAALHALAERLMPAAGRQRLDAIAANLDLLGDRLRELQRRQGGPSISL
ncbi:DUF7844 domain-containing protein [Luteimonas sp. RIT-PG2_3]